MKTVLLLGGPAAGQRVEVHGSMSSIMLSDPDTAKSVSYKVVPMCSHGEVHWFGVLDGADPLALLIAGYGMNVVPKVEDPADEDDQLEEGVTAEQVAAEANAWPSTPDFRMRDNY